MMIESDETACMEPVHQEMSHFTSIASPKPITIIDNKAYNSVISAHDLKQLEMKQTPPTSRNNSTTRNRNNIV